MVGSKYMYLDLWTDFHVLVLVLSLKWYLYLYLDPKYLKNTKYIQVHTSTLYSVKSYILYIDSSELCGDIIG